MKFYTDAGNPAAPDTGRPIRPQHYDPHRRRFAPSNHMAVAFDGREYVLKGTRSFDIWDENVFEKWTRQLTAEQVQELERVLGKVGGDIDKLLKLDWTKDPENVAAKFASRVNALMTKEYDRAVLTATFVKTFQPLLENAPEMFGHRHRFLSITTFDDHDARALNWLSRTGEDNMGRAIGKYVDEGNSQAIVKIVHQGVKDGFGPDEVARDVATYVKDGIPQNKTSYARLVANNLMAHSRSHSAVTSMRQAGFQQFIWNSVLDESTTDFCCEQYTPIATIGGPMLAIDVPVGVRILTKTQQWKRVIEKTVRDCGRWRCFRFMDGNKLIVTPAHRISSNWEWTKADRLENNDFVDTMRHDQRRDSIYKGEMQIKEARTRHFYSRAVNFEVEGDDPTFVAGESHVIVHNCRYMHGRVISIPDSTAAMDRTYKGGYTPEALEKNSPFFIMKKNTIMLGNTKVADVKRSAIGTWNDTGEFKSYGADLTKQNMVAPPCHHNCRSQLIPMFSTRQLAPTVTPAKAPKIGKAAPLPAWLVASAWKDDAVLVQIIADEAERFDAWLLDRRIPSDKYGPRHVSDYLGEMKKMELTPRITDSLKAWQEGNKGARAFKEMRDGNILLAVILEGLLRYPRFMQAMHPDLFFYSLAWAAGRIK